METQVEEKGLHVFRAARRSCRDWADTNAKLVSVQRVEVSHTGGSKNSKDEDKLSL